MTKGSGVNPALAPLSPASAELNARPSIRQRISDIISLRSLSVRANLDTANTLKKLRVGLGAGAVALRAAAGFSAIAATGAVLAESLEGNAMPEAAAIDPVVNEAAATETPEELPEIEPAAHETQEEDEPEVIETDLFEVSLDGRYNPRTGANTVWHEVVTFAENNHIRLNEAEKREVVGNALREMRLSWGDARDLPIGFNREVSAEAVFGDDWPPPTEPEARPERAPGLPAEVDICEVAPQAPQCDTDFPPWWLPPLLIGAAIAGVGAGIGGYAAGRQRERRIVEVHPTDPPRGSRWRPWGERFSRRREGQGVHHVAAVNHLERPYVVSTPPSDLLYHYPTAPAVPPAWLAHQQQRIAFGFTPEGASLSEDEDDGKDGEKKPRRKFYI